jgi:hypothetical protein
LAQELIDQRRLTVIDVGNDGDITNLIHWGNLSAARQKPPTLRETGVESNRSVNRRSLVTTRGRTEIASEFYARFSF